MQIETAYIDVPVEGQAMRTFVAAPSDGQRYPGIIFYSDIFQLTPSTLRWVSRLSSYGFVVAAPEIYHRIEPAGTVLGFDNEGKERGQADVEALRVEQFDADISAALAWLAGYSRVAPGPLGAAGHCTGGHLAFRAALQPTVAATACWYATGLHNGKLGGDADAGTLQRSGEIEGELLMIFGARDPHTPPDGLDHIHGELQRSGANFTWHVYDAEHAFGRDVGPRHDAEATDKAFAETVALFRRLLANAS